MTTPDETGRTDLRPGGRPGAVLAPPADQDGSWEDALRAGAEAEGEAGSVEAELAVIHLLRHARAPEGLSDARLEAVLRAVDDAIGVAERESAPKPLWKRWSWSWLGGTALAAAAAAVALIVLLPGGDGPERPTEVAQGESPLAEQVEKQFQILAPKAREQAKRETEDNRDTLRGGLLDDALNVQTQGTMEGAP